MKSLLIVLALALFSFTDSKKEAQGSATISVQNTNDGNVITWSFESTETVGCVQIEVKRKATGGIWKTTFCAPQSGPAGNCLAQFVKEASGTCTEKYKPAKGSTYRLVVRRDDGSILFYSNEAST